MRQGIPSIVLAALSGKPDEVRAAYLDGEDVDSTDEHGRTALHYAARNDDADSAKLLLGADAAPSKPDHQGWTPLHFAAQAYAIRVAPALLAAHAIVDAPDENGNTPLWRAVFSSEGRGKMIQLLLKKGADGDRKNSHGISPRELASTIANYDVKRWFR